MHYKVFFFILLLAPIHFFGQSSNPDRGIVFTDTIVPRVDIFIDPDTLDWIYENVESYQEFHATFIFSNGNLTDTMDNIGFRLRGNTSRYSAKKSFKVSFNTFDPGRKWHGLEKMNLNGEHNDPSVIRAKLCWDLLSDFNLPTARTNHVKLYINYNYHGLYLNIEHIDEEYVKSRFGNNNGNLYKCLYPADLDYLGSDPDNYKIMQGEDRRVYDLKINTQADDYSDLAHFIDVLNNTPNADFACEIEKVFNIQDYLKVIAVDIFTGNWDGYIYNQNNFYLYYNTQTGKMEYINYDVDNTFGIDWFDRDWANRNIYDWQQHGSNVRPLYTRVMENQELRDQYSYYMDQLLSEVIDLNEYVDRINYFKNSNASHVAADPFYPLDYGFTINDYYDSYVEALGMHVKYGLIPFVNVRLLSASGQLEENDMLPIIKYISNNHIQPDDDLWVTATILSDKQITGVEIAYTINGGSLQQSSMFDDGNHNDGLANDNIYGGSVPAIEVNTTLHYQVVAADNLGISSTKPCDPVEIIVTASTQAALFINEFMASNDSTIADEAGEYDDWIEIYNGDSQSINLGDKYLSDDLNFRNKWQMPDIDLAPGEFLLIWADDDMEQGDNHTNFKLKASGEEIGLFDSEQTGFFVLDSLTYGEQTTDVSKGRIQDGSTNWKYFNFPTPGYSNILGSIDDQNNGKQIFFYPNPVSTGILYFSNPGSGKLFSYTGELVLQFNKTSKLDVSNLIPGIYLLITSENQTSKIIIQ